MTREQEADIQWRLLNFYNESEAALWLRSPHPQLEDRKPQDASYEELLAIIDRLESGAYL